MEDDIFKPDPKDEEPQVFSISFNTGKSRFSRRKFVETATKTAAAAAAISGCTPLNKIIGGTATFTPLPTDTAAPTDTPTPTQTMTPSPTVTRTPTPTFTPTPVSITIKVKNQGARVRTGPGTNYTIMGSLAYNVALVAIARLADNSWIKVIVNTADLPNFQDPSISEVVGWIRSDQVNLTGLSLDILPVEAAPPTPTPLPHETIEPGEDGVQYQYTDAYGNVQNFTLPCGAPIPEGAVCVCNCVASCTCDAYVVPPPSDEGSGGTVCTCDSVHYWYPN